MAELTITTFLSLDGIMQAPGAPDEDRSGGFEHGGWLVPFFDGDMMEIMTGIFERGEAYVLGRGTYEIFAHHWPNVPDDQQDAIAKKLNALPKYVATRTLKSLAWNNSKVMGDPVSDVKAIKACYSGEVQVHGSPGLAQTLIEHDLIDEYRLLVFPVVVGGGKRLFGAGAKPATMALVTTRTTSTGAVYQVYRRAGELKTGMIGT
jgi:dihydrofolate reductase